MNITERRFKNLMKEKFNEFEKKSDHIFTISFHFKLENGNNINVFFDRISYINAIEKCTISFYDRKNEILKNVLENEKNIYFLEQKINEIINENN